jgi:hypothetical protein
LNLAVSYCSVKVVMMLCDFKVQVFSACEPWSLLYPSGHVREIQPCNSSAREVTCWCSLVNILSLVSLSVQGQDTGVGSQLGSGIPVSAIQVTPR